MITWKVDAWESVHEGSVLRWYIGVRVRCMGGSVVEVPRIEVAVQVTVDDSGIS